MNNHNSAAPHAVQPLLAMCTRAQMKQIHFCLVWCESLYDRCRKTEVGPIVSVRAAHTLYDDRRLGFTVNINSGRSRNVKNGVKTVFGDVPVFTLYTCSKAARAAACCCCRAAAALRSSTFRLGVNYYVTELISNNKDSNSMT